MRFVISSSCEQHTEACTTVSVSVNGEILTGGDDCSLWTWNTYSEPISQVGVYESYPTIVKWLPFSSGGGSALRKSRGEGGTGDGAAAGTRDYKDALKEMCIVGFADGSFRFINTAVKRQEKFIDAHIGAVSGIAFPPDGTLLATSGEDGLVKIWSMAGIQRSILANVGKCIQTLCWGTGNDEMQGDCVLFTSGNEVYIKSLNASVKRQIKWKAHNGPILCADWSRMNNYIVTGSEDCTYKVWDFYGRNLFTSHLLEYPVTALEFSPDGELFAAGSFLQLHICDKTGWTQCCDEVEGGSVMALNWTSDGTQVIIGSGGGALVVAQLVDWSLHWGKYTATLIDSKKLGVQDGVKGKLEEIDQRDKIIKMAIGYNHLVICTTTQCIAYNVEKLSSPAVLDLRDAVITLMLSEKVFALADCSQGISVFTYEGRLVDHFKVAAIMRPEMISSLLVSLSNDTVACRCPSDFKKILVFDLNSMGGGKAGTWGAEGRSIGINHHLDVVELHLSQSGSRKNNDRKIAFIDHNRDLYINFVGGTGVGGSTAPTNASKTTTTVAALGGAAAVGSKGSSLSLKLSTMVSSARFHEENDALVAISDGRLVTSYFPTVAFVDRDLFPLTKLVREDDAESFGGNDRIQSFSGVRVGVRRGTDGASLLFGIHPAPGMLYSFMCQENWGAAIRLCRFLKDPTLWCMLAGMGVKTGQLNAASVAYGALGDLVKVRFIDSVKVIPIPEGRQAELAVFMHNVIDAERILLQAGLVYRCIDICCRLGNWERALEIAVERRTHVDTVIVRRQEYLAHSGRRENLDKFIQIAASIKVDREVIEEKVKKEIEKEMQRPNARAYQ